MSPTILIARPHPFIVDEMGPFLSSLGFAIKKVDAIHQIGAAAESCCGVIVSLAVSSPLNASAEAVLQQLLRTGRKLPLLFTGLLDIEKQRNGIESLLASTGLKANILSPATFATLPPNSGAPITYLTKDDLSDTKKRMVAAQMIRQYFC